MEPYTLNPQPETLNAKRQTRCPNPRYGWSVLHYAAFKGFARVCRKLVRLGADINAVNRDGAPPSRYEKD